MTFAVAAGPGPALPRGADLAGALELAERLLAQLPPAAVLALADLGDIALPPVAGGPVDRAGLRAAAPLYLAAELESAQLLPTVEMLAGLVASGGLRLTDGPAAERLYAFWRGRSQRFTAVERRAFFAGLFGTSGWPALAGPQGTNTAFEELLVDLAEQLHLAGAGDRPAALVRMAADRLAANLSVRAGGMVAYAAQDIVAVIRQGIALIELPDVQRSVGAQSAWGVVAVVSAHHLGVTPDLGAHVARGRNGQVLLAWLAETAGDPAGGIPRADPVVSAAAAAWLRASLTLAEYHDAPGR